MLLRLDLLGQKCMLLHIDWISGSNAVVKTYAFLSYACIGNICHPDSGNIHNWFLKMQLLVLYGSGCIYIITKTYDLVIAMLSNIVKKETMTQQIHLR